MMCNKQVGNNENIYHLSSGTEATIELKIIAKLKFLIHIKDEYKSKADDFLNYLLGLETTNLGLVWIGSSEWGSLRYAGNFAMFAMQAGYYGLQPEAAFKFAEQQMNYVLGDAGHSYVCGFGSNPPKRPHHR